MRFNTIITPKSLDEAYEAHMHHKDSVIMAGGAFLKLQNRTVETVIDLKELGLDYITELTGMIEIGPMVTLRNFETHHALPEALSSAVRNIAGVAVRNVATVGGSVMGRYPFSDVLTALLALNAHLEFYKHGHISLEAYLEKPFEERDILTKIVVPQAKTSLFNSTQATYTDFSTVNLAVVKNGDIRIAVGARPNVATVISHADLSLTSTELLANIDFGSDFKASADYRRTLAETMLSDALKEVRQWK